MAICLEIPMCFRLLHYTACVCSLAFGYFVFAFSFTKDVCNNIRSLNEMAKAKQFEADIFKQFTAFISFHATVKELRSTFEKPTEFTNKNCQILFFLE